MSRFVRGVAGALFSSLLLAGCDNSGMSSLLYDGIGSSLQQPDTLNRALMAEKYFGLMCQRAGVRTVANAGVPITCDFQSMQQHDWKHVVFAALNDIDERCDQYIESLTSARRDRDAYTRQLRQTATSTIAIAGLASGPTALTVSVLQAAFGLVESSVDNYYSRLLLTLDTSIVHGVVRKQQKQFRDILAGNYLSLVQSKPTAYFAIRGYLRLCMPTTIEAEVNATISDVQYDGKQNRILDNINPDLEALTAAVPAAVIARGGVGTDPTKQLVQAPSNRDINLPAKNAITPLETTLKEGQLRQIQRNLCVAVDTGDFGVGDSLTRRAIRMYKQARRGKGGETANGQIDSADLLGELTNDTSGCDRHNFRNAYEKFKWKDKAGLDDFKNLLGLALQQIAVGNKVTAAEAQLAGKSAASGSIDGFRDGLKLIEKNLGINRRGELTFRTFEEVNRLNNKRSDTSKPPSD